MQTPEQTPAPVEVVCGPELPVATLVIGKAATEVAELLPRLFNLCRAAQATAACLAMDLPAPTADLGREILRDHLMKLYVLWPRLLGLDPLPLPSDWQEGGEALLVQLFDAPFPDTPERFAATLDTDRGLAPMLAALARALPPGLGAGPPLPALTDAAAFAREACENSVAGRQADHPVMRAVEAERGRDLYWRAVARLFDLADAARGTLPAPRLPAPGRALVPAARGTYAVQAEVSGGRVTQFARWTPTDHLLAKNGIMDITIASLSDPDQRTLDLVMDILDPCSPMRFEETRHA